MSTELNLRLNAKTSGAGVPPKEAIAFFDAKKLEVGFDFRDVWKEEHRNAFTVAKLMSKQLLGDVRDSLSRALKEGQTYREWAKSIRSNLTDAGWWGEKVETDPKTGKSKVVQLGSVRRLRHIYSMNMRSARAAGQWHRIQRTKEARPFLEYKLGPVITGHREEHKLWEGTRLPADDIFWQTHMTPNGHNCKCFVIQLSVRQAERRGGVTSRPSMRTVEWENKRTGKTENIPVGIDPGFNFNPGEQRKFK